MASDPQIRDRDRCGDDLLERIDELTASLLESADQGMGGSGGYGWRWLLVACGTEIRRLRAYQRQRADRPARLRDLADTLEGCEWNHPLGSAELCRNAAEELELLREGGGV